MSENTNNGSVTNNKKHVETRVQRLTNPRQATPAALEVIAYDNSIKLSFAPELPANQQTPDRRYDYEHTVITMVYRHKANELYNAYKAVIVPAIKEGRAERISVPIANVHQLMIDTDPDENGTPRPKVRLIRNIDPVTLIADGANVIQYEFNTGEYILGYDEVTGNFKERVITYNELELFMRDLNSMVEASSNQYVHTDRCVNRYWKDMQDDKLNKIGGALNLDLAYKPRAVQGSIFSSKPSNESPSNSQTITSLDQLENQLGDLPFN